MTDILERAKKFGLEVDVWRSNRSRSFSFSRAGRNLSSTLRGAAQADIWLSGYEAGIARVFDARSRSSGMCQWFALCDHAAVTTRKHSILGDVPICKRCNDKVEALS